MKLDYEIMSRYQCDICKQLIKEQGLALRVCQLFLGKNEHNSDGTRAWRGMGSVHVHRACLHPELLKIIEQADKVYKKQQKEYERKEKIRASL